MEVLKQCINDLNRNGVQIEFIGREGDWMEHFTKVFITPPPTEYDFSIYNEAVKAIKELEHKKERIENKIANLEQDAKYFNEAAKECAAAAAKLRKELEEL